MTPDRVAVVHDNREITYRDLHDRSSRVAQGLHELGVGHGDRVAYLGANDPTFMEVLFAAGALGAVFVPLNWRLASPEIAHLLADSASSALVFAPAQASVVQAARDAAPTGSFIALGNATDETATSYASLLDHEPFDGDESVNLDEPCMLLYTSGTTGRPKGVVLSHGNVAWNSFNVLIDTDLRHDEVSLVCAPLFHVAGLNMITLPTLLKGGTVVLHSAFDPQRALATIETNRVTCVFGVPAMFSAIAQLDEWEQADLSSLRTVMCGGAPVPLALIRTYLDRGILFLQGYGMTETSPGALFLDAEHAATKAGTAGVPSFFTDVRVVRPDMTETAAGESGEIVVAGPNIMQGYWGLPEETAAAVTDGEWFHSGDVAVRDDDGYVRVSDRIKDLIISGGENISPAEVENAFYEHPAVAECAVIGVPDERWGEVGRAVVVTKPDAHPSEEELLAHLDGRIARFKKPKSVVFVESLPRGGAGKVLKHELRHAYGAP